jgi:hypothetical protein
MHVHLLAGVFGKQRFVGVGTTAAEILGSSFASSMPSLRCSGDPANARNPPLRTVLPPT